MFSKFLTTAAALALIVAPAAASTFVVDFSSGGTVAGLGDGNSRTFTTISGSDTLRVRATGWSVDGTRVRDSFLASFGAAGLGVISGDDNGGLGNEHTVDNRNRIDFILLQFDRSVSLQSGVFNAYRLSGTNYSDNDASIGNLTSALAWNSQPAWDGGNVSLLATMWTGAQSVTNTGSSAAININAAARSGNMWMIAASIPNSDGRFDAFKFNTLRVQAVPEPATWAMMIAGFGVIGAAMRRQRRASVTATA